MPTDTRLQRIDPFDLPLAVPAKGSPRSQGRGPAIAMVVGCALWVLAPLLGLAWIVTSNQSQVFAVDSPAWVSIEESTESSTDRVDIALLWDAPEPLRAPAWSGLVQAVSVAPGATVSSGDPIAVVDGITRIAWHSDAPFYRVLQSGASGADVAVLKSLLSARGQAQNSSDIFDARTTSGVRQLAADLGVPDSRYLTHFDPAWIVFLPEPTFVIAEVAFAVAASAPATGESIATGEERLVNAAIVEGGSATSGPQSANGESTGFETTEFHDLVSKRGLVPDLDGTLVYSSLEIVVEEANTAIPVEGLEQLAASISLGTRAVPAHLVAPPVAGQVRLPAASIASDEGSSVVCVRVGDSMRSETVEVISSDDQGVLVTGRLQVGSMVRVPGPSSSNPCQSVSEE